MPAMRPVREGTGGLYVTRGCTVWLGSTRREIGARITTGEKFRARARTVYRDGEGVL